jgi:hypothetical protein
MPAATKAAWKGLGLVLIVVTTALVACREAAPLQPRRASYEEQLRQALFDAVQPVTVTNCELTRFGEEHDGGYLMCSNLLQAVKAGYSYGISGYDKWGCDVSTTLAVPVHQYDCFNTTVPACPAGRTVFHAECVDGVSRTEDGRFFDTMKSQFKRNGTLGQHIALKIDVEGAEWNSFLLAPDDLFEQIDQMAVEFHGVAESKYLNVVERLKQFFYIAHLHYNNAACIEGVAPFPTWAFEVLFVSKRLGVVDGNRPATVLHPLDALNNPAAPDCQPDAG